MSEGKTHTRSSGTKIGRPSGYSPGVLPLVATVPDPATATQIAEHLGISTRTLYSWLEVHPEFLQAVTRRRKDADDQVVSALFRRALGYEYVEVTKKVEEGGEGGPSVTETTTPKHMPPDTKAAQHWLNNRRPEEWRGDNKGIIINVDHVERVQLALVKLGIE